MEGLVSASGVFVAPLWYCAWRGVFNVCVETLCVSHSIPNGLTV